MTLLALFLILISFYAELLQFYLIRRINLFNED
jgi:hypothetical protein